jgi:hypothetical protein
MAGISPTLPFILPLPDRRNNGCVFQEKYDGGTRLAEAGFR